MRFKSVPWSPDETVRLSAYLDYYAKKRSERGRWSVEVTLCKLASHLDFRSSNQIERQLFWLWGGQDKASSKQKFQDVFKYGSRCLKRLSNNLRQLISDTLKAIEISEETQRIGTTQTLRSGKPRSVSVEPQCFTPGHGAQSVETATELPPKISCTAGLQQALPAVDGQIDYTVKDGVLHTQGTGIPVPGVSAPADVKLTSSNTRGEVADSFQSIPDSDIGDDAEDPFGTELAAMKRKPFGLENPQDVPVIQDDRISETPSVFQTSNAHEMHDLLCDLYYENKFLRQKSSQLDQECTHLQRRARRNQSIQWVLAKDPECSMFSGIHDQDKVILDLESRLRCQEFVQPFLKLSTYPQGLLDLNKIQLAFKRIGSAIRCLAKVQEFQYSSASPSVSESEALHNLIELSGGDEFLSLLDHVETPQLASSNLTGLMMLSLTGAAICEWVFLTEQRCAATVSTLLFEKYQNLLGSLCGEEGLRNFDLAAHRALGLDKDFEKIYISQTATRLAKTLFAALSNVKSVDSISAQEDYIQNQLVKVFFHALTIKYEVMACKNKFEIIWPPANSVIKSDLIDKYPAESNAIPCAESINMRVRLAIMPGLRCYTHDRKLGESAFLKAGKVLIGSPVWISKAIVSVK